MSGSQTKAPGSAGGYLPGNAKTSADKAAKDALKAEGAASQATADAGDAKALATGAESIAHGARKEADAFERDIVSAKKAAAKAESELARLKAPRRLKPTTQAAMVNVLGFAAFRGTPFDLSVAADEESINLMRTGQSILLRAGWKQLAAGGTISLSGSNPAVGISLNTGILVEIDVSRVKKWGSAVETLTNLLKAGGLAAKGNVARTGVIPIAIHITIGRKPMK